MIRKEADINAKDKRNNTALILAAFGGDFQIKKWRNRSDRLIIHIFIHLGHQGVVTFLAENGADLNWRDNKNDTALSSAISTSNFSIENCKNDENLYFEIILTNHSFIHL